MVRRALMIYCLSDRLLHLSSSLNFFRHFVLSQLVCIVATLDGSIEHRCMSIDYLKQKGRFNSYDYHWHTDLWLIWVTRAPQETVWTSPVNRARLKYRIYQVRRCYEFHRRFNDLSTPLTQTKVAFATWMGSHKNWWSLRPDEGIVSASPIVFNSLTDSFFIEYLQLRLYFYCEMYTTINGNLKKLHLISLLRSGAYRTVRFAMGRKKSPWCRPPGIVASFRQNYSRWTQLYDANYEWGGSPEEY